MAPRPCIELPADFQSRLLVFVDTEEEFDWTKPIGTAARSVDALPHLRDAHAVFARHGIAPHYLVDYPVVMAPGAKDLFRDLAADHPLEIGAHLHPWVTPPHSEAVCQFHSYPGNLPIALEKAKLKTLTNAIGDKLGREPDVYKAGRYGTGQNTPTILRSLGYKVDVSVRSRFDYSYLEGPNFSHQSSEPYWLDDSATVLEIPASTAYCGWLAAAGPRVQQASVRRGRPSLADGLMSKLGVLSRINLTPEGYSIAEAISCIDRLRAEGAKIFSISFHSPSLQAGNTPYVKCERDKRQLLSWLNEVFGYLTEEVHAAPSTAIATYNQIKALG